MSGSESSGRAGRGPSPRQREILAVIRAYSRQHGFSPTLREIGDAVGLRSHASVQEQIQRLERDGYLRRPEGKRRALELTELTTGRLPVPGQMLPLLGTIAAGQALFTEEQIEELIDVPLLLLESGADGFLLRVGDDSMINAGITPGDLIVVCRQPDAADGEVVVALVGTDESTSEVTVKRFRRRRRRIWLEPANTNYEPIEPGYLRVLGKVTGLLRRL